MTEKHRKIVWLIAVAIFVAFMGLVGYFIGVPMVQLAEDPEAFQAWVDEAGVMGRVLFVGMVVLQVLVAFIPGEPVEIAAGYAFGFWEGSLLTLIGFVIGSWLVFALVRRYGSKLVEVFFPSKQIAEFGFLKNPKKTKIIATILMVVPGTPKDFLSYFAGLTKLTTQEWLLIVFFGRIPSLVTSTLTGAAAGTKNYALSAAMLVLTIMISLAGILYYRWICNQEKEKEAAERSES